MNFLFYLFIIITIVGFDQYTKRLVSILIEQGSEKIIIDGFFNIINVKNYGAGFSIMQNQRLLLIILPIVVILVLIYYLIKRKYKTKLELISYIFIIGGALGNLIDRSFKGFVIDFLDFIFFGYHYPTFNVADCFITIGAFLLIIYLIIESRHGKTKNNSRRY